MGGTALGGALKRGSDGVWYWADGTPEPRVTDLRISDWFRFPTREEDGDTYVEVPMSRAKTEPQLKWVRFGHYRMVPSSAPGAPASVLSSRQRRMFAFDDAPQVPEVYLVPQEDWDRVELATIDARWDPAHHEDIIARAREVNAR
jgi:hypothetical protein